jgi:hypothetical protein
MLKSSIVVGILTVALLSPGNAAVSGPRAATAITGIFESATPITWVCGPRRCVWRPRWHGFVPRWAVAWGSTPSPRVLLREAPDRLGRSLPIVRCCLGRGELSNVTERTYVATPRR